jgi:hypothetical protein
LSISNQQVLPKVVRVPCFHQSLRGFFLNHGC